MEPRARHHGDFSSPPVELAPREKHRRYPSFVATSLATLEGADLAAEERIWELLYLGERLISYVAIILIADYLRTPNKTNALSFSVQKALVEPTAGTWFDLVTRLSNGLEEADLLVPDFHHQVRSAHFRKQCTELVELRNRLAHHSVRPDQAQKRSLVESLTEGVHYLVNLDFLCDYELRVGVAALHGLSPSFERLPSGPVVLVNPVDPDNERERRVLHPFILLRDAVLRFDERKDAYLPFACGAKQLFLFNGYRQLKGRTLIKLSPLERGVAEALWLEEEVPSPWALLECRRHIEPARIYPGQTCEVSLTLTNLGGHAAEVASFRDDPPAGTVLAGEAPKLGAVRLAPRESRRISYSLEVGERRRRYRFPRELMPFRDAETGRELCCSVESGALEVTPHSTPRLLFRRRVPKAGTVLAVDEPVTITLDVENSGSPLIRMRHREVLPDGAELLSGELEYDGAVRGGSATPLLRYGLRFTRAGRAEFQGATDRASLAATGPFGADEVHLNDPPLHLSVVEGSPPRLTSPDSSKPTLARALTISVAGEELRVEALLEIRNDGDRTARNIRLRETPPPGFAFVGEPRLTWPELAKGEKTQLRYEVRGPRRGDFAWPESSISFEDVLQGELRLAVESVSLQKFQDADQIGIVGRRRELERLERWLTELQTRGSGPGVQGMIVGPEGIGKSRLLHELLNRVSPQDRLVVLIGKMTRGQPDHYVIADMLSAWMGQPRGGRMSNDQLLRWRSVELAKRLAQLVRLDAQSRTTTVLTRILSGEERDPGTIRGALVNLLHDLTGVAGQKAVLALDDCHWLSDSWLKELDLLLGEVRELPLLFLCSSRRTPAVERLIARFDSEHLIEVQSLNEADTTELMDRIAVYPRVGRDLGRELWETTQGNPFHLVHSLLHLRETDGIERRGGEWHLAAEYSKLLPGASYELVQVRVEKELLDAGLVDTAHLLDLLSIILSPIPENLLFKVAGQDGGELDRSSFVASLGRLQSMGFLERRDGQVSIRFDAQREALNRKLNDGLLEEWHRRIALVLAEDRSLLEDRILRGEYFHHLRRADRATRAERVDDLRAAARESDRAGDLGTALELYRELVALGASSSAEELADRIEIVELEGILGAEEVEASLKDAESRLAGLKRKDRRSHRARLRRNRILFLLNGGRFEEAAILVRGWKKPLLRAWRLDDLRVRAEVLLESGKLEKLEDLIEEGLRRSREKKDIEHIEHEASLWDLKARLWERRGAAAMAEEAFNEVMKLLDRVQNKYLRSRLQTHVTGRTLREMGDPERWKKDGFSQERIRTMLEDALHVQRKNLDRPGQGRTLRNFGLFHDGRGELAEAYRRYAEAIPYLRSSHRDLWRSTLFRMARVLRQSEEPRPEAGERSERLKLAVSHLNEIVRSFGADEHRRQFPYVEALQLLDEISQVLDDPRRRRECLVELDDLFGTATTASGYEWELRSVYHRLIALALQEESWEEARKLLAESDTLNERASKRQVEGWRPSLRRLNLEARIMTRLQEYDAARAALIRLAREAVGQRGSRSLRGRLLMAVLEGLSRIWALNDEPATAVLRDFGYLVEMAGSLDSELIESLYDQAVVLAKARNNPELISDLGLATARVLRLSGDPGAAFRLSRKLLNDHFSLYQECGEGRTHLLRALTSFAASGGSEEETDEWMKRVQEEFLKREDFFILGYLRKLQADRALERKELMRAYEYFDEARRLWLERCRRDAELVEALRTVVIGFLRCNRTEQAVGLLEQLMEFSIEDRDHRGFFRYYSLLADYGGRLESELVRRLVGVGLGFYLGQSHFQRRAAFAYETAKLITDFDREAGPLQLGINRYLLSVDFLPANQYHDMAVVHQGASELELGAALLELSAIEDEKLVREGLSLVKCRNSAQTQAELAEIYLKFRWFNQALRAAVKAVDFIGVNLRHWSAQPLASTELEERDLLAFDSDVKIYLSAYGVLSQAYRKVGGVDQLADPMMLYSLALDFLPLDVSQRATVVGNHFERVEAALKSGLSTDPRYHAVESSDREEVRLRLEEHKRAIKEETESLRLDLFGRRANLEELLWSVLRRADWETSARLLLTQRGVEEAEAEVEESLEPPEVDAEARRRVIGLIVAAWEEQGQPDRAERWRPHLQEQAE